jgi:hypothetical protein
MLTWFLAIPPAVALGGIVTWLARPGLHRDPTLRGAHIVSVCVATIEGLDGALILGFLSLLSTSNVDF